jgi:cytidine deaminase
MNYRSLVQLAQTARKYSYSPYSHFRVGAAILTTTGKTYTGCNIENSSFGLTLCAERTAIFKAISEGEKHFKAIAVVSGEDGFTTPCGACRQVLMDLAGNIDCVMSNRKGQIRVARLNDLLPHPFGRKNLRKRTHRSR